MATETVSVDRVIESAPGPIFELVADAGKHPLIDGSGTVQATLEGTTELLSLGSEFGMSMKRGAPYKMVSKVIEFEKDRRIAWQSRAHGPLGAFIGGRIWRYELDDLGDGRTRVTETWDLRKDKQRLLLARFGRMASETKRNMERTLEKIAGLVESPGK